MHIKYTMCIYTFFTALLVPEVDPGTRGACMYLHYSISATHLQEVGDVSDSTSSFVGMRNHNDLKRNEMMIDSQNTLGTLSHSVYYTII